MGWMDDPHPDEPGEDGPLPPPIPPILYSVYEEGPFASCIACGRDLADRFTLYQVQKTWRQGEVVLEIAVCLPCLAEQVKEFSRESLAKMESFFTRAYRPTDSLDSCHFCRCAVTAEGEYEIAALCGGIYLARPPVTMCGACGARVQEGLSRKTRDSWGEFMDRNLPGVPGVMTPDHLPMTL